MIGDDIRQLTKPEVSKFIPLGFIRSPSGGKNHSAEFFTIRVKFQNIDPTFVVLQIAFMLFFHIQFFTVFVELHLFRQRIGNVKLDFFTGFFQRCGKISRFTGQTGNNRAGLDGNIVMRLKRFDFSLNNRRYQIFIGGFSGKLFAYFGGIAAQGRLFFNDGNVVAGLGRIESR